MLTEPSLSAQTLQMFTALRLLRAKWGGAFVLGLGLRDGGQAFALASLAAGAAGLFLESDPAVLRAAQRNGCCTFVVTTLDEALRALKNEVRQGRAITVGLSGDTARWLDEITERGVLPAVVAAETPHNLSRLIEWGSLPLNGVGLVSLGHASVDLAAVLHEATNDRWEVREDVAASMTDRRTRDATLATNCGEDDVVAAAMRAWLQVAPSLFPRNTERSVWMRVRP